MIKTIVISGEKKKNHLKLKTQWPSKSKFLAFLREVQGVKMTGTVYV